MKFYCKPTLTLFLLLYVAIQSAQAQDTLRITLQDAVRIALSDNPTIKVAGQEIPVSYTHLTLPTSDLV